MQNLSSEETSLLLTIQSKPNQRLTMYGDMLKVGFIKVLHARNRLIELGVIVEDASGNLSVDQDELDKINTEIMVAHGVSTVEMYVEETEPMEAETVQKFEDVDNKVLEMLRASPLGRTAKELALPFGTKGTSLNWTLRNLIKANQIVKRDTKYFIAEECDKVVSIPVVVDDRRVVDTNLELRTFILQFDGEHTQEQLYAAMSKTYNINKNKFCEMFSDLVLDGYYNVFDGHEYVQHDMDYSPDNKHERCVNVTSDQGISELLKDYLQDTESFNLRSVVTATGLRHDRITSKLAEWGYDVSDQALIRKVAAPVETGFTKFEDIDVNKARQLIFGFVKIDVFLKRFNLDPAAKDDVVRMLELVKMATFDPDSGFLCPHKPTPVPKVEPEEVEEEIGTEIQNEENAADIAYVDGGIVDHGEPEEPVIEEPNQVEEYVQRYEDGVIEKVVRGGISESTAENLKSKYASSVQTTPVEPAKEHPTHITNRSSSLYGHKILRVDGQGFYCVDNNPDYVWIAAQQDWKEQESPNSFECAPEPKHEEPKLKSFADIELPGDTSGLHQFLGDGGPGAAMPEAAQPEPKIVNPQWTMTLLMLTERFQHEHQYTTANILREIHDYLAPK